MNAVVPTMMNLPITFKRSFNIPFLTALALMLYLCSSCNRTGKTAGREGNQAQDADFAESTPDSVAIKIGSDTLKVIPGESIGRFQLKEDIENSKLFDLLGKADNGDAAMCKSWAMWYWTDSSRSSSNEFDVYSSCDPHLDMRKSIQILRLSGAKFVIDIGISERSTSKEIKERFPMMKSKGKFYTSEGKAVFLEDDKETGIAFEFISADSAAIISAVMIHLPGSQITDSYLPFYIEKGL